MRYEVWESVVLTVLEKPEALHSAATVVDISRSGYRVLAAKRLMIGTEVLITLNSVAITGRVRHCEAGPENCFSAGIEITHVAGGVAAPVQVGGRQPDALWGWRNEPVAIRSGQSRHHTLKSIRAPKAPR